MEVNKLSEKDLHDYETARRAINGDRKAYEEFFKKHKDSVYYVLLKIVRHKSDAEALTIKVFEKSFNSLSDYPIQLPFGTWLFKVTAELATEFLKEKENI